jgi:hypothetical protein
MPPSAAFFASPSASSMKIGFFATGAVSHSTSTSAA